MRLSNFWANATSWGVGGLLGPNVGNLIGVCDRDEEAEGLGAPLEAEVTIGEVDELFLDGAGSIICGKVFWCSSCHWRKSCCCFRRNSYAVSGLFDFFASSELPLLCVDGP